MTAERFTLLDDNSDGLPFGVALRVLGFLLRGAAVEHERRSVMEAG